MNDNTPSDAVETGGPTEPAKANAQQAPRKKAPRPAAAAETEGYRFADVISGAFDEDEARADVPVPKRVLLPQPETPKLHKVLAQAGLGSRIEMEQMILEGRISVNNEPAHVGQRVQQANTPRRNARSAGRRRSRRPSRSEQALV